MRLFNFINVLQKSCRFRQRPRWVRPYLRDLYYRRLDQGPEPFRPRSAWSGWNFTAEISALCNRICEPLPSDAVIRALTDKSYAVPHEPHNEEYANTGKQLANSYIMAFLRYVYPRCPEEWVAQIADFLLSECQLAFTSSSLGLKDLIRYSNATSATGLPLVTAPPTNIQLADALCALIGTLAEQNKSRALLFVRDFLITPLVDLDLTGEIITIDKPVRLLFGLLASENRSPPEFRLQSQCSMQNIMACYQVGVYCDRELLGEAPGETLEIAQQEASSQALRNLFGLTEYRPPLPLRGPLIELDLSPNAKTNVSIATYLLQAATCTPQTMSANG